MEYTFLLVEDDAEIREIITDYLFEKSEGTFHIDCAGTGGEGWKKSMENEYDLVLLDVMLPEIDGKPRQISKPRKSFNPDLGI